MVGEQTGFESMTKDVIRVHQDPCALDGAAWNALLDRQSRPTPFMRWDYLAALHASGSAVPRTGWAPRFVTVHRGAQLVAAALVGGGSVALYCEITPHTGTRACMALMSEKKIRHLPVVDGSTVLGMISIRDVLDDSIADHESTIAQLESYIHS